MQVIGHEAIRQRLASRRDVASIERQEQLEMSVACEEILTVGAPVENVVCLASLEWMRVGHLMVAAEPINL
ncbi:MAG: hypothetical protein KAX36_01315 [Thermoflexales bacterium]|nr:hypothetical protein [Thermoflexales bacterium]